MYLQKGMVNEIQRYKLKSCGFGTLSVIRGISPVTKRQALPLYLEGLGFHSIGRFLKCSHVAIN
jgi:transposase-like protein